MASSNRKETSQNCTHAIGSWWDNCFEQNNCLPHVKIVPAIRKSSGIIAFRTLCECVSKKFCDFVCTRVSCLDWTFYAGTSFDLTVHMDTHTHTHAHTHAHTHTHTTHTHTQHTHTQHTHTHTTHTHTHTHTHTEGSETNYMYRYGFGIFLTLAQQLSCNHTKPTTDINTANLSAHISDLAIHAASTDSRSQSQHNM